MIYRSVGSRLIVSSKRLSCLEAKTAKTPVSWANAWAIDAPIPSLAPVIIQTFPDNDFGSEKKKFFWDYFWKKNLKNFKVSR